MLTFINLSESIDPIVDDVDVVDHDGLCGRWTRDVCSVMEVRVKCIFTHFRYFNFPVFYCRAGGGSLGNRSQAMERSAHF